MDKLLINTLLIQLIIIYPSIVLTISSYYNVIETKTDETSKKYCIIDYIYDENSTHFQNRNNFYLIENYLSGDESQFCRSSGQQLDKNITNKYVLINYSKECDINEQINYFNNSLINGLFITITCSVDIENSINITNNTLNDNQFSVSLITDTSVESLLSLGQNISLKLFDINFDNDLVRIDGSMIVIWFLATFTVVLGSFWSGFVRLKIFNLTHNQTTQSTESTDEVKESATESKSVEEEPFLNISPFWVLGFVILMALMLLALYFFYQYLVYVIIGLFTLASIASLFACGEPLLLKILPTRITRPSFKLLTQKCGQMYFYQLVLLLFALSVSITWLLIRKESYSWFLQDILGVCFSLNMLRTIRLPSYKICVILLSLLFFYDIFFVFITPLITAKGNSVMVDVATGGSTKSRCGKPGEQLPMVLRVPHQLFRSESSDPLDVCFPSRDSILGFGDILVPGLLVSYCHAFDLISGIKYRIYYITTCICYGLGLITTFAALYLMNGNAQPALLYLVPFTIIPPLLIAVYRKELKQLWFGPESYVTLQKSNAKKELSIEDVNREDNLLIDSMPTNLS